MGRSLAHIEDFPRERATEKTANAKPFSVPAGDSSPAAWDVFGSALAAAAAHCEAANCNSSSVPPALFPRAASARARRILDSRTAPSGQAEIPCHHPSNRAHSIREVETANPINEIHLAALSVSAPPAPVRNKKSARILRGGP